MIITIGVSGCMKDSEGVFDVPKNQAHQALEEKYNMEFAELEYVSDKLGPVPTPVFQVIFKTHPVWNEEQVFKVYTTNLSGKDIKDDFLWYLLENEYRKLIGNIIDDNFGGIECEYFYTITQDEGRTTYNDGVSTNNTTLEEALKSESIKAHIDIYMYVENMEEEYFIETAKDLIKKLDDKNVVADISLKSTLNKEGYYYVEENINESFSNYREFLYMSYFDKIPDNDGDGEYNFRYINNH